MLLNILWILTSNVLSEMLYIVKRVGLQAFSLCVCKKMGGWSI
mgnify:CR=1 FL=1